MIRGAVHRENPNSVPSSFDTEIDARLDVFGGVEPVAWGQSPSGTHTAYPCRHLQEVLAHRTNVETIFQKKVMFVTCVVTGK